MILPILIITTTVFQWIQITDKGPANIIRIAFESKSAGYVPHPNCNGLKGYNLTSGYDEIRKRCT